MAEGAMTAFLSGVSELFTVVIGWLGDIVEVIVTNPLLLVCTAGVMLVGFAVGILGRLIRF